MNDYKYEAPAAVTNQLLAIHQSLELAQLAVNGWDRPGLGRELDRIRWALGDLIAQVFPITDNHRLNSETKEWEEVHPFANATERGE